MRFLLINPPYALTEPPQIPMGLQYIGGALLEAGVEVRVLDLLVRRSGADVLLEAIREFEPDVVGTSSVTMNWFEASQVLRWAKQANPEILTDPSFAAYAGPIYETYGDGFFTEAFAAQTRDALAAMSDAQEQTESLETETEGTT